MSKIKKNFVLENLEVLDISTEGKAIAKAENSPSPGVTSEFEIHSFTLVSQDWKITKTLLLTKIAITSKSEGNFSGTTLLEHTATRLD